MSALRDSALAALAAALLAGSCGEGGSAAGSRGGAPTMFDAPAAESTPPPAAAPEIPDDAPVVAFLGDSIGAGLHLAEHQAFPVLLRDRLAEEGRPFRLVNSCESGRTTSGGVTALEWVLRRAPALVVVALGGNDGLRGIPVEEVERNLRAMIERARGAGAAVLLLGVRLPPNYGAYGERFDALYPALAAEYGTAFVPFYMQGVGGVPELNLPDGLHPTAEGQQRLADNVVDALRAALP